MYGFTYQNLNIVVYVQCPKIVWLNKHKPEELEINPQTLARMEEGDKVGDLAMGLFGDFTEVTTYTNNKLDLSKMIEKTKQEMNEGTSVICEASFSYDGLYCAVDILKKENDGWSIYEVKSSSGDAKKEGKKILKMYTFLISLIRNTF